MASLTKVFTAFLLFSIWLAALPTASRAGPASGPVAVRIAWDFKDMEQGLKIFELKGRPELWKTESKKSSEPLPVTTEIPDSTFKLSPGRSKRFALVYKNKTDKTQHFFAAPHSAEPAENSLGFKFKCLCINHAFKVGPGETWYRVVEFKLSPEFVGDQLTVKHTLIGIDEKRAERINKLPPMDSSGHDM